jgi:hypothetical protein
MVETIIQAVIETIIQSLIKSRAGDIKELGS